MDVDDYGSAAGEARRGLIKEARNCPPVDARPVDELGLGEVLRVEPGRLALGPARDPAARNLEGVGVGGSARRGQREAQLGAAAPPADSGDQSGRQLGNTALGARRGADHAQHAHAVLVGDAGDRAPVGGQIEFVHVPGNAVREDAIAPGREVQVREALELRAPVGGDVHALAVPAELRCAVGDAVALLFGREQRLLSGRDVDEPEIGLVGGDRLRQQDLAVVRRPIGGFVAAAFQLEDHAVARRVRWIHRPEVQVAPGAARRHVGVAVALV